MDKILFSYHGRDSSLPSGRRAMGTGNAPCQGYIGVERKVIWVHVYYKVQFSYLFEKKFYLHIIRGIRNYLIVKHFAFALSEAVSYCFCHMPSESLALSVNSSGCSLSHHTVNEGASTSISYVSCAVQEVTSSTRHGARYCDVPCWNFLWPRWTASLASHNACPLTHKTRYWKL